MLVHALTTRLVNRHVARRLARVIPHPGIRAAAMVMSSVVVSYAVEKALAKVAGKRPSLAFARRPVRAA